MPENRGKRKQKIGIVVGNKMEKTITVRIQYATPHPVYGRRVKKYSKFSVHDDKKEAHIGDTVRIMETRPLSKTKRWRLVGVVR